MRKLEIADAEIMQLAIRQEIERSEESRYDHRLHQRGFHSDELSVASAQAHRGRVSIDTCSPQLGLRTGKLLRVRAGAKTGVRRRPTEWPRCLSG